MKGRFIMRTRFEEQLKKLNNSLIEMGALVERAISDACLALVEKNIELANKAIAYDEDVNTMEKEIEGLCLKILLQQQPVAGDLRLVSSVLKIITDLERVGDHASDISNITIHLAKTPYRKKLDNIKEMSVKTMQMVNESIEAFVNMDKKLAKKVINDDDIVDALFGEVKKDCIEMIKQDAESGDQAIDFIMIAKYFERIGDHATNIAEWVIFSLTGVHKNSKIM